MHVYAKLGCHFLLFAKVAVYVLSKIHFNMKSFNFTKISFIQVKTDLTSVLLKSAVKISTW